MHECGVTWAPRFVRDRHRELVEVARRAKKHDDDVVVVVQHQGHVLAEAMIACMRARAEFEPGIEVPTLQTFPAIFVGPLHGFGTNPGDAWRRSSVSETPARVIAAGKFPIIVLGHGWNGVFELQPGEVAS